MIRQAHNLPEGLVRACVVMIVILAATARIRAQAEDDWVGKRVVPRSLEFVLRIDDEPVETSRKRIAIYRVERTDGPSLWLQSEAQQRLNGWAKAEDIIPFERAIDFFNDSIRAHPKDAFAYAMRAFVREAKHEYGTALDDYDQAIRLDPGNAQLYCARGRIRALMNEADRAILDYNEAIRLDSRSALALTCRGMAWATKKDYDKAIDDFSEAIWLDPLGIPAYLLRGVTWREKHENQKAIIDYNMVIRLDSENAPAYTSRALSWKALKSYGKAVADFEHAIHLDSKEPIAFDGVAGIRATCPDARFRDGKGAVESATKACALTRWKDASYLSTLAAAHAEAGDFDSAVKWQATANTLYPEVKDRTRGEARLKLYRENKPYRETEP